MQNISGEISASDPAEYEQAVRPWDVLCRPTTRGPFEYHMAYVMTPGFTFYREKYRNTVLLKGIAPPGMLAFSVPVVPGKDSIFWKAPACQSVFPGMAEDHLDVVFSRHHEHYVVLIALESLWKHAAADVVPGLMRAAALHSLPTSPNAMRRFALWLTRKLDTVRRNPALLQQPHVVRSLEQELIEQLVSSVRIDRTPMPPPQTSCKQRAFRKALDYLYDNIDCELTVPELTRIAGTSQRTLEHAFRETFDMTPLGFMRNRRLHAVRHALHIASPEDDVKVRDVAYEYGFYELGRFAAFYRQVFGELPSATLKSGG
jgi:AraC family ethanolamine operon transcriptional activator